MIVIGKSFTFEAAHRLQDHDGKCYNLHGHSYRVEVSVIGLSLQDSGSSRGMVLDFGVLKEWWKRIEPTLDHRTILERGDEVIEALRPVGVMMHITDYPPTAENFAQFLKGELFEWLNEVAPQLSLQVSVRVYETATSYAEA